MENFLLGTVECTDDFSSPEPRKEERKRGSHEKDIAIKKKDDKQKCQAGAHGLVDVICYTRKFLIEDANRLKTKPYCFLNLVTALLNLAGAPRSLTSH